MLMEKVKSKDFESLQNWKVGREGPPQSVPEMDVPR